MWGSGWYHDWEGTIGCKDGVCKVTLGLQPQQRFQAAGKIASLDGTEQWDVYTPWSNDVLGDAQRSTLVRRPSGEWILFTVDGREFRFASVCESCPYANPAFTGWQGYTFYSSSPYCVDPGEGGMARLVRVVERDGRSVNVEYDREHGVLYRLSDDAGNQLELRSGGTCDDTSARELRYNGAVVATYDVDSVGLRVVRDSTGNPLRSYSYIPGPVCHPNPTGLGAICWVVSPLEAVKDGAGAETVRFSYDAGGGPWATGVTDAGSSIGVVYSDDRVVTTEQLGGTTAQCTRTITPDGEVTAVSGQCSCGVEGSYTYSNHRVVCSADSLGHVTYNERDQYSRITRTLKYAGGVCPPTSTPPEPYRETRYEYGLRKAIAQGVGMDIETRTGESWTSVVNPNWTAGKRDDYDPAPQPYDPAGYSCGPLPPGSVVCRHMSYGYVASINGSAFERHVTFYSYDARARLVRTVGPIIVEHPEIGVTPLEERAYWPDDDATLARRGQLREVRRYASPQSAPLVTTFDYDPFGLFRATAPDGGVTTFVHDARGRPDYVVGPDGRQYHLRYYDGLTPRIVVLPSGRAIRYGYDARGRRNSVELLSGDPDAAGASPAIAWTEHTDYDAAGNAVHVERRDAVGAVTWSADREYDIRRRLVREFHPEKPHVARVYDYDAAGFLQAMVDEEGRATRLTPDALLRVQVVRKEGLDALNQAYRVDVAAYAYPAGGDALASVTDANGTTTTYRRDDFGRVSSVQSPSLNTQTSWFTYDARGNLLERRGLGTTLTFTYDGLDRPLAMTSAFDWGSPPIAYAFTYDGPTTRGRLATVSDGTRVSAFAYDGEGRLLVETVTESEVGAQLVTAYGYDADGELSDVLYPSGYAVHYKRDGATGEVTAATDGETGEYLATGIDRLPWGPVRHLVFGNGLMLTAAHDLRYQPRSLLSGPVALAYGWSDAGDVVSIGDAAGERVFTYDPQDRLVAATDGTAYGYDGNGNRTSTTMEGGATASFAYTFDQVNSGTRSDGPQYGFAYDDAMNVTGIVNVNGGETRILCLRHDALGRVAQVGLTPPWNNARSCASESAITQVLARYRYDYRNQRIARWLASTGEWTYIVSAADGRVLEELHPAPGATRWQADRSYVWLGSEPLAQVEHSGATKDTYYFHADALGMPRAMTNASGQIVWSAAVRPYGEVAETAVPDPLSGRTVVTNLRLPGQYDERLFGSLGLQGPYYNWNRWYLPGLGRYLELDPIALRGGFNSQYGVDWYNYAAGNPTRYVDRDGRFLGPAIGWGLQVAFDLLAGYGVWCLFSSGQCMPPPPQPQPPSPPLMPCHGGPTPFGPPGVRPAPPQPVPSERECDEEWAKAAEICTELMRNPRAFPNPRGGRMSMEQCMKGYVSEVCGGNPIDWGPGGPFGR